MYKLFIFSLFITFFVFLSRLLCAQQSTPKNGNFYMAIGAVFLLQWAYSGLFKIPKKDHLKFWAERL